MKIFFALLTICLSGFEVSASAISEQAKSIRMIGSHLGRLDKVEVDKRTDIALTYSYNRIVRIFDLSTYLETSRHDLDHEIDDIKLITGGFITVSSSLEECRIEIRRYTFTKKASFDRFCISSMGSSEGQMSISGDQSLLIFNSNKGPILFDLVNWNLAKTFPDFIGLTPFLSPSGKIVAFSIAGRFPETTFLQTETNHIIKKLNGHGGDFVKFSLDESEVAFLKGYKGTSSGEAWAEVWNLANFHLQSQIKFSQIDDRMRYGIGIERETSGKWLMFFEGEYTENGWLRKLTKGIELNPGSSTRDVFISNSRAISGPISMLQTKGKVIANYQGTSLGVWNLDDSELSKILPERIGWVRSTVGAQEGIAVAGDKLGVLSWWNLTTGKEIKRKRYHDDEVDSIVVNKSMELGISKGRDGSIAAWNVKTGDIRWVRRAINGESFHAARFLYNLDLVLSIVSSRSHPSGEELCSVVYRNLKTGELVKERLFHKKSWRSKCFLSSDTEQLLEISGRIDGKVEMIRKEVSTGNVLNQFSIEHPSAFVSPTILADSKVLFSMGSGRFSLINSSTGDLIGELFDPSAVGKNVSSIAVSPNSRWMVAVSDIKPNNTDEPVLSYFDLSSYELVNSQVLYGDRADNYSRSISFSDTETSAYLSGDDGNFIVWNFIEDAQ